MIACTIRRETFVAIRLLRNVGRFFVRIYREPICRAARNLKVTTVGFKSGIFKPAGVRRLARRRQVRHAVNVYRWKAWTPFVVSPREQVGTAMRLSSTAGECFTILRSSEGYCQFVDSNGCCRGGGAGGGHPLRPCEVGIGGNDDDRWSACLPSPLCSGCGDPIILAEIQ